MDRSDQIFQYPDIQQGEVLPYMFEPQADEANSPAGEACLIINPVAMCSVLLGASSS